MSNAKNEKSSLKRRFNFENCLSEYESILDSSFKFFK